MSDNNDANELRDGGESDRPCQIMIKVDERGVKYFQVTTPYGVRSIYMDGNPADWKRKLDEICGATTT